LIGVNHDKLMAAIAWRVTDKRVLRLIGAFLKVGAMENGLVSPGKKEHREAVRSLRFYRSSNPASYLPLPAVWAFIASATNTPAADFCRTVRVDHSTLGHDAVTCDRSPEVSSTTFHA
jgi:hypothetical protein